MAKRKCVCCGEWIEADEASVPYKNRYAHQRCFDVAMATLRNDKQQKLQAKAQEKKAQKGLQPTKIKVLKGGLSEEEYQKKKQYYDYLQTLLEDGQLTAKIYAVSEDYIKRYHFTFESMYRTLVYLHDIREKTLVGDVVGLIPYYHDEAQKFYAEVEELEKEADKAKPHYQQKVIHVDVHRENKSTAKMIDILSIGTG